MSNVVELNVKEDAILFLDEIKSPLPVQAATYQLVLNIENIAQCGYFNKLNTKPTNIR